ncbi:MAG: hypothetical protein ACK5L0_05960 [Candidatus Fimivivens sp.]
MADKIGIRYCGGCNPRFDRVALEKQIEARFLDCTFEPVVRSVDCDAALIICGCPARCVNVADLSQAQIPLVIVGHQDTPDGVSNRLRAALRDST